MTVPSLRVRHFECNFFLLLFVFFFTPYVFMQVLTPAFTQKKSQNDFVGLEIILLVAEVMFFHFHLGWSDCYGPPSPLRVSKTSKKKSHGLYAFVAIFMSNLHNFTICLTFKRNGQAFLKTLRLPFSPSYQCYSTNSVTLKLAP